MLKKSSQVALGGVIASLCTLLMLLTGFFPFLTYAAPAAAGFLLIAIVVDCGYRWAVLVYLVVSLLSLFVVPDKQAAIIFVFLGYYPIAKDYLDRHVKGRVLRWIIKFSIFNLSILLAYGLMLYVFKMPDIMTDMGSLGRFTGLVTLLAGNAVFIVFELALSRIFYFYQYFFRPRFLRKIK